MADAPGLAHFSDIPMVVEAVVRRPPLKFSELMALRVGSIITTGHPAGETVDVLVGEALIGTAEFVDARGCAAVRMVTFRGKN